MKKVCKSSNLFNPSLLVALCLFTFTAIRAAETQDIKIKFKSVAEAVAYEIQWLKTNDESSESVIENSKIKNSPLIKSIPIEIKYFRIRTIREHNIAGYWSQPYSVDKFLKQEIILPFVRLNVNHTVDKKYLNTKELSLLNKNQSSSNELFFSLNESPFMKYVRPLTFPKDGSYVLKYLIKNTEGHIIKEETHLFEVDRTAPTNFAKLLPPFYISKRQVWLGKNSVVSIISEDKSSGLDKIFYRIVKNTSDDKSFMVYKNTKPLVNINDFVCYKCRFEYYSQDKLTNKSSTYFLPVSLDMKAPIVSKIDTTVKVNTFNYSKDFLFWHIDENSLPVKIEVIIDSKPFKQYYGLNYFQINTDLLPKGEHEIILNVTDQLENTGTWVGKYKLSNKERTK